MNGTESPLGDGLQHSEWRAPTHYDPPVRIVDPGETYVHERMRQTRSQMAEQGIWTIDSSRGESSFGIPEFFGIRNRKRLHELVGEAFLQEIREYHDPARIRRVEKQLKERLNITKGEVILGSAGSDGLLMDIVYKLIPEDTLVMGHGPQFPQVAYYALSRNDQTSYLSVQPKRIITRENSRDAFQVNDYTVAAGVARMIQEVELEKNQGEKKLLYVCNPGTPLGDTVKIDQLRHLAKVAQQYNHILLVDEAFGDVLEAEESAIQLTEEYESVIVTRTLSKFYGMPEAGIGYAAMSKTIADRYQNLLPPYSFRGPQLFIAEQMFTTNIMEKFRKAKIPQMRARKRQLLRALDHYGVPYLPTDDRVPILTVVGPNERYHSVLEKGYKLRTAQGNAFGITHSDFTDQFVRVTVQNSRRRVSDQAMMLRLGYYFPR